MVKLPTNLFLMMPFFWFIDGRFLAVSSHGFFSMCMQKAREFSAISSHDTIFLDYGPTLMNSFNLNCLPRGLVSKHHHIGDQNFRVVPILRGQNSVPKNIQHLSNHDSGQPLSSSQQGIQVLRPLTCEELSPVNNHMHEFRRESFHSQAL